MKSILCLLCSDYTRNVTDVTTEFESAPLGPGVKNALWQLALALIFKGAITVFTFGIKVRSEKNIFAFSIFTFCNKSQRKVSSVRQFAELNLNCGLLGLRFLQVSSFRAWRSEPSPGA